MIKDVAIFDKGISEISETCGIQKGDTIISYSQFSIYDACPRSWELKYIKRIREEEQSIHLIFGTAIHTVIQHWLTVMYKKTVDAAFKLDLDGMLKKELQSEYKKEYEKTNVHFSTAQELYEFWEDGVEILKAIRSKKVQTDIFPRRKIEFIGCEIPIMIPPDPNKKTVKFMAFLDLVFREKGSNKYIIIDIKTSTKGWNDWQKKDHTKISQVLFYKKYFSELYGVDESRITVSYLILKRKLYLNSDFLQRRYQTFVPAQGKQTVKKAHARLMDFVHTSFNDDGTYNTNRVYPPYAGKNFKNCRFCKYSESEELCPVNKRITDL